MFLRTLDFSGDTTYRVCRTYPELNPYYDLLERVLQIFANKKATDGREQKIYLVPDPSCNKEDIVFTLNIDTSWGAIHILDRMIQSNIVSTTDVLNKKITVEQWKEYITWAGLRRDNRPAKKRKFITDKYRITNASKTGLLKFFPTIEKCYSHLTKDYIYYGTFAVDSFKRNRDLRNKFAYVMNNLGDEQSKKIYEESLLKDPSTIWNNYFKRLTENQQYFDYIKLDQNSVILNCGVAKGQEIPFFLSFGVKKILNVDPSGEPLISPYVQKWIDAYPKTNLFLEHAVWNKDEKLECSVYTLNGNVKQLVEGKRIKTILTEYNIDRLDLIKLNVEGIERELTSDIIDTVKHFRPQLAISIYHSAEDLVDIPIQLMKACPNYNFYIQNYSFGSVEIILYCIPKELC